MAAFTSERRFTENRALIPSSGDRRRIAWTYGSKRENRDPISGAPGAHPIGTGLGAAAGGMAAGAAAGAVAGPAGALAGAAVGAVVGGLAGKGIAEKIDPTAEEAYWRTQYTREPYYERGYTFDDYYPGYRTGWEGRGRYSGRTYEQVERDLQRDYQRNRGNSQLEWAKNRHAVRAAWDRFDTTDPFEHMQ
jgi:hypothetical protein